MDKYIQVSGRHSWSLFSFPPKAQAGPIVYPWGDVEGDFFCVYFDAFPSASGAGAFDNLTGAMTMRTGAGQAEKALGTNHLSGAAAGPAMNRGGAGFAPGAFAGVTGHMFADFDGFISSESGLFERNGDIGA